MKSLFLLLCCSLTVLSNTQSILDSLVWPATPTSVPSLTDVPNELPILPSGESLVDAGIWVIFEDTILVNDAGHAKIVRKARAVDWSSGTDSTFFFLMNVDETNQLSLPQHEVTYDQQTDYIINAIDLVANPVAGHIYTFSSVDPTRTSIALEPGLLNTTAQVFELTESRWYNSTSIVPVPCTDGYALQAFDSLYRHIVDGADAILKASDFDDNSFFNCGTFDILISLDGTNYESEIVLDIDQPDDSKPVYVKYKTDTGYEVVRQSVLVLDIDLQYYLTKVIELKSFEQGDIVDIDIWSSGIDSLFGFAYSLDLLDAELLNVKNIHPSLSALSQVAHSYIDNEVKLLWTSATPTTALADGEVWLTLEIKVNQAGSSEDIISWEDQSLGPEFIIGTHNTLYVIGAQFDFEFATKGSSTSTSKTIEDAAITLYPNPAIDGLIYIAGISETASVELYNMQGQKLSLTKVTAGSYDISSLASGTYMVTVTDRAVTHQCLLIK